MISYPTVEVWAVSRLTNELLDGRSSSWLDDDVRADRFEHDIDYLHEAAGRACYESWSRPNPRTDTNPSYLQNVIDLGHFSVMTHGSITLYITGVSRSLTHELVRSRFLAFSQLSQRYVPMSEMDWVCPPAELENVDAHADYEYLWEKALAVYESRSKHLELVNGEKGMTRTVARKKAREAARAVLPNMCETRIVVTGNVRAWRDFVNQRWTEHADEEIDRLAGVVASVMREYAPNSTSDLARKED